MKSQLARNDAYSFIVEMRDRNRRDTRKTVPAYSTSTRALGRVGMSRTDVTDVARKEQRQKEDLAAALVGRRAGQCSQV
ncbi:MAG: hypothetical protein ACLTW9_10060 [Enterocloster sp.]